MLALQNKMKQEFSPQENPHKSTLPRARGNGKLAREMPARRNPYAQACAGQFPQFPAALTCARLTAPERVFRFGTRYDNGWYGIMRPAQVQLWRQVLAPGHLFERPARPANLSPIDAGRVDASTWGAHVIKNMGITWAPQQRHANALQVLARLFHRFERERPAERPTAPPWAYSQA